MADRNRKMYNSVRCAPYSKTSLKPELEILRKVQEQPGFRAHLIFLVTPSSTALEASYTILQNAVDYIGSTVKVLNGGLVMPIADIDKFLYRYVLIIDNEIIIEGHYASESLAKKGLAELAIELLQKTCFTIIRKIHPRCSPQVNLAPGRAEKTSLVVVAGNVTPGGSEQLSNTPLKGGIGERMMRGMGWSGGGLGAQEQGRTDIVESYIQIHREGLGSINIAQEVTKLLKKHAESRTINSIAFSNDFSKSERGIIHQVARKLNLKSKSYGQADDRILVVQSKMRLIDLVKSLLEVGGQNEQYQLLMPSDFQSS